MEGATTTDQSEIAVVSILRNESEPQGLSKKNCQRSVLPFNFGNQLLASKRTYFPLCGMETILFS